MKLVQYDATLKNLFQSAPHRLVELLTGSRATEVLVPEYSAVRVRRPDLVLRLENGRVYHLELLSTGDGQIPWRMLEYYYLFVQQYSEPPLQQVLYVGKEPVAIASGIQQDALQFRYSVVDMHELDSAPLLDSPSLADNLLAILCRLEEPRTAVRRILGRVGSLPAQAATDALEKLVILSKLRALGSLLGEEQRNMPIPIDDDLLDEPLIRDLVSKRVRQGEARGEARGGATLLRRQLEQRFGSLPGWALARLESADTSMLEDWGVRLLDATSLEQVLRG